MDLLPSTYTSQQSDLLLMNNITTPQKYLLQVVTSDELFQNYSSGLLTFATVACIVFILLGVPGNLITIIALARCKKVRNATAVFIINLSLSDLLFCCFNLPLAASTFWNRAWTHGELLCRFFPLLRYGLLAVSLFTILAITINRYVMIGHPRIYPRIYRRKYLAIMVAGTWIAAFGTLIPTWRGIWGTFGLDRYVGSCSILPDENDHSPKEFLFVMAFVVPCVSIVVCYARIFYIVRKTALRSRDPGILNGNSIRILPPPARQPETRNNNNNNNNNSNNSNNNNNNNSNNNNNNNIDDANNLLLQQNNLQNSTDNILKPNDDHILIIENGHKKYMNDNDIEISENSSSISHTNYNMYGVSSGGGLSNSACDNGGNGIVINRSTPGIKHLKYIDSSVESDFPPSSLTAATRHTNDTKLLTNSNRNLSTISIAKTVEFCDDIEYTSISDYNKCRNSSSEERDDHNSLEKIKKHFKRHGPGGGGGGGGGDVGGIVQEVDSAVEESTCSSENNQIYHITNENNCNQLLSVQVEPSSSSGIDIPYDPESPPRRIKKSFTASLRRTKRAKDKGGGGGGGPLGKTTGIGGSTGILSACSITTIRKHSTMNTSGASILYPGRMSAKDRRLLKMILVIFISFLICYLPITITKIIRTVHEIHIVNIMGYLLIYLTTCINPIVYVVMSSEYRQAYVNLLMCRTATTRKKPDAIQHRT